MASSSTYVALAVTAFLTALVAAVTMGLFSANNQFQVQGRTVVVTGGSQGLGLAFAKQLAAKGANVVIVARDLSKLRTALTEIKTQSANPKQRFESLSYDLESPDSAPEILETVTQWNGGEAPDVILNCAGFCIPGFFATTEIKSLRAQMDTIYWSSAYMAHAALKRWLPLPQPPAGTAQKKTRHIIFTCSILAFFPLAGYAPYSPPKAAMRSLADTLAQEAAVYNTAHPTQEIKIHTVFPMGILTPGFENENKTKPALTVELEKGDKPQTPEEVARRAIAGLEAGEGMITTMLSGHIIRGWGLAGSVRNGLVDLLWSFIGTIAVLFVMPGFMAQCRKWGREKGMGGAR